MKVIESSLVYFHIMFVIKRATGIALISLLNIYVFNIILILNISKSFIYCKFNYMSQIMFPE